MPARIRFRLDRLGLANLGEAKGPGGGLHQLRTDYAPGYRVYFGRAAGQIVLLLCGGTKQTQSQDIQLARDYWLDYGSRSL